MCSNELQLNPAKTEIIWFTSSRRQIQIPQVPFCVGTATITPSSVIRDLGIYLDSNLSMTTHISKTVSNCFSAMRLILYTADLLRLVEQFHLHSHLYADNTKIYWFALPLQPLSCKTGFSRVLLRLVCGCALMGSNLIQPRQRSFGLPQVVDRSRFHRLLFVWSLLPLLCPSLFVTLVSTLTQIST